MESKIVAELMSQTECDIENAYTLLHSNHWNVQAAVDAWLNKQVESNLRVNPYQNGHDDDLANQMENPTTACDNKKLCRGISRATDNVPLVGRARTAISADFENAYFKLDRYFIETPEFTFTLPDLNVYGIDFKSFIEKDLIETSAMCSLEQAGRLNWWAEFGLCQKLWPLSTSGDGNCLLHAASLAMWGFHDRLLTLRKALFWFLKESACKSALYRRWRWQQTRTNAQSGFIYSEEEWQSEWEGILSMASTAPRNGKEENTTYESLEEIHVLALAHILKRPIIVIADVMLKDMNGEAIAPIPFGGVYLPFEIPMTECHLSPLLLTYDMAHFSALVAMDVEGGAVTPNPMIPLVDSNNCLLPLHFNVDPGGSFDWNTVDDQQIINNFVLTEKEHLCLLKQYLNVIVITSPGSPEDEGYTCSEDEIERKFSEIRSCSDEAVSNIFGNNKNRAAKQFQSVAKQFGSIGKSMSKKLKKNFVKMTKSNKRSEESIYLYRKFLCCQLHMKRHQYQNEMVQNYLQFAQLRFLKEKQVEVELTKCINANCSNVGANATSYMCQKCFDQQCKEESQLNKDTQAVPVGKSKFYYEVDSKNTLQTNCPKPINFNRTLYLSKSTFYNDTGKPFITLPAVAARASNAPDDGEESFPDSGSNQNLTSQHYCSYNMGISSNTDVDKEYQSNNVCII